MSYTVSDDQLRELLLLESEALTAIKAGIKYDNLKPALRIAVARLQASHKILLEIANISIDKKH